MDDLPDPNDSLAHQGLHATLQTQLGRTPWWALSLGFHFLLGAVLVVLVATVRPAPTRLLIAATFELEQSDCWDTEQIEEVELERDLAPADVDPDHPAIQEATDERPESPEDFYDESTGDVNNSRSDAPSPQYSAASLGAGSLSGGRAGQSGQGTFAKRYMRGQCTYCRAAAPHVDRSLDWLKRHQSRDGSWSCDNFQHRCRTNVCSGAGSTADYTPGVTALAVLAFLGNGHTHLHGRYQGVTKRALRYLMSIQTADGCVGPKVADGHYIYNHAIAAMALAEAYGMTNSRRLRQPAQRAIDFLVAAQNPGLGWRYGIRPGDNDTSITGWAVLALKSARLAQLRVPTQAFVGAKNWLDKATDDSFYKAGYIHKGDCGARLGSPGCGSPDCGGGSPPKFQPTEAMTAAALTSRIFMGARPNDPVIRGGMTLLRNDPPRWDPDGCGNAFYYWYYGALATFQYGGTTWQVWERALQGALLQTQHRTGDEKGSWDPGGSVWGAAGGRVYATAINTLTLQIYRRYARVLRASKKRR